MRITLAFVFYLLSVVSTAQTTSYLTDLAALKSIVEETPSFKGQMRGEKLSWYNEMYKRLASDTVANPDSYHYFYNLAQLLFPLRDNHVGFYQLPNYSNFKTKASIDSFVTTKAFFDYPTLAINLDSLKAELVKKPLQSIEGVYYYDTFYTVGLFKKREKEYVGVVLSSEVNLWQKGQIAIHLYEYAPNLYKAIYGHPFYKYFLLQPVEKYQHQSLVNSSFYSSFTNNTYSKYPEQIDHRNLPGSNFKFVLKNLEKDVQYLLIRSFQADMKTAQASQRFFDSIKNSLMATNIVLDLRNNEGGAEKEMRRYLKLLKNYCKNGHLYVLQNNGTLSRAEIFILELKQLRNVTTLGSQTKGMLAYGSNFGRRERLPSGRFEIYPTDMNDNARLLPYEDYGISPDISLNDDRNWIEQVIAIINKQ